MTANQRRPGFRLPWSSEDEDASAVAAPEGVAPEQGPTSDAPTTTTAPEAAEPAKAEGPESTPVAPDASASDAAAPAAAPAEATPASPMPAAAEEASPDFMRDLVSAMRRVADEARQAGLSEVQATTDEHVKRLETEAEERRNELRARADSDVAGIGEWAKTEAERIRKEAEQRVVARREQLELELGAETARAEAETKALRQRVGEYERELEAYHAQLAEINDPAAFAAAAKRMPRPPALEPRTRTAPAPVTPEAAPAAEAAASEPAAAGSAPTAVAAPTPERAADTNGVTPSSEVHPAEEEVLATRLAELDAELPDAEAEPTAPAGEPTTTEIVVSGLGSFGAITGFRQALAGVSGIEGVALSLGQTGEFIFRATHRVGFDVGMAITSLEGDTAKIESRPDGNLHVTLERPR
jgi:hypothetical protein